MSKNKKHQLFLLIFSILLVFFLVRQQNYQLEISAQSNCPKKIQGDADCNGIINDADYGIWKGEFLGVGVNLPTLPQPTNTGIPPTVTEIPPTIPSIPISPTISNIPSSPTCRLAGQSCNRTNNFCCQGLECLIDRDTGARICR